MAAEPTGLESSSQTHPLVSHRVRSTESPVTSEQPDVNTKQRTQTSVDGQFYQTQ